MGSACRVLDPLDNDAGNSGEQGNKNEHCPINFTLTPTLFLKNG